MNKIATTLIIAAGLGLSAASFAASDAYIPHESLFDPAYLNTLSSNVPHSVAPDTGSSTEPISHESTYDPAYLKALTATSGVRTAEGLTLNHESLFDPAYLRTITRERMAPTHRANLQHTQYTGS